jgi:hypothetical protein
MGGYVAQLLAPDMVFLLGVLSAATIICHQTYYQLWLSPLAKFRGTLFASVALAAVDGWRPAARILR